ncbi:menaquinol-cytochrome c reductase iron-sulfur subunit precursor [Murinocardiopsis flavida]|uniref:Cytochrome bc1 complex Rieske iron-sulfur subunit n=1 Tax=Murinocardiopsis flavida TaxID=645275 RepID=A0A2P8D005_9ACTN|nr:Rieske 2Fe-2S domain-containing protein [Murinocardiopsis flavida]PSK90555.1 menaquinol-cytochrome c reductase iron-sulfur subunit precursor [Murinocardiopsis flavida]
MTDHNNTNDDADNGRVIGTPTGGDSETLVGPNADAHGEHQGPYPADETHVWPEEVQRRGEKVAALWFFVAFLAGVGFFVAYFYFHPNAQDEPSIADPATAQYANMAIGGTIALALFAIGAGMTVWVRQVMPHYEVAIPYDEFPSAPTEKASFGDFFMRGAHESGFIKRKLMRRTLLLAMAPLGLAPIVLLRDTGPLPGDKLHHTIWRKGMRMVVEGTDHEIREADLENEPGGMITALPKHDESDPEHAHGLSLNEQAKSVILLIRMPEDDFNPEMERLNWTHKGIVAYSKICTHVGCPAALYERTSHRILCPCHQSTFDAANGAEIVFGPAHRPLPQLPVTVDDEGFLVAGGDFSSAPGPTFWDAERGA